MKNLLKVVLVLSLAAGLTACKKNIKDDANADLTAGSSSEMVLEETTTEVVPAVELSLGTVHFALDKYNLTAENRKVLEANAKAIKAKAAEGFKVVVEGNCDDRGTISYNIALGEKRASEVKAYYTRLGIAAENIAVVSYGEEKPVCYEATQSCWAKNRRADTVLIVK